MSIRSASFFLSVSLGICVHGQDSLFYTNGNFVTGRVEEVGVELVRYRTWSADAPVIVVAEKRDLARVKLESGQEFIFNNASTDVPATAEFLARKQAITMDVIAPALNHIVLGYERAIGRRVSICARVGYIGFWNYDDGDDAFNSTGGLLRVGVKFILPHSPRRTLTARDQHPLSGWYLRPEILFSSWERRYNSYQGYFPPYLVSTTKEPYSSAAVNLTIGRQVLLGERFTFDISGGLGYGLQWQQGRIMGASDFDQHRQYYSFSHLFMGDRTPLTMSGGLQFGYVF